MIIESFASSSKGNCYSVTDGKTALLLECGIPLNKIREKTRLEFDACLVTHEHMDHAKSLVKLLKNCKEVYATKGTFDNFDCGTFKNYAKVVKANNKYIIGTFNVIPFATEHDAAEPVGYYIKSRASGRTLLFATDTYYIKNRFDKIDYLMIECNYAYDIAKKNIENGKLSNVMAKRLLKSHFELENVKKFILEQDVSKIKGIYLLHLSNGNSDADRFQKEIKKISGCPVWVCPE